MPISDVSMGALKKKGNKSPLKQTPGDAEGDIVSTHF